MRRLLHLNTTFPGYKFTNTSTISFANNIIVRSGTSSDSWNSEMAAVDISGNVKNVVFENTYIYDAQHDAVRILNGASGISFSGLNVYGAGVNGLTSNGTNGALFKFSGISASPDITVDKLQYANIPYANIFYGSRNNCDVSNEVNLGTGYAYEIPKGTNAGIIKIEGIQNPGSNNDVQKETQNSKNQSDEKETVNAQDELKISKPAKAKIRKAVRHKNNKSVKVFLRKTKGANGYQIAYSTSIKFRRKTTKYVMSKKSEKVIKKLKPKKKYYVKARAYKKVQGKYYYGKWSAVKTIKTR